MRRFSTVMMLIALLVSSAVLPAEAAEAAVAPRRLHLASYSLTVSSPTAGASVCDFGSQLNCGSVNLSVVLTGLAGRDLPTTPGPPSGDLSGTVHVIRTYGCQDIATGNRLARYNTRVEEDAVLETRRSLGYRLPSTGDVVNISVYAFLQDAQPGNCPAGSQAMTYKIKAGGAKLSLQSSWASVPSAAYSAPARAQWRGAISTPTSS